MQYLGFFLLVVAVVGVIFGVLQHVKMKKILAAPFKKTGEIASNPSVADAKGTVSCEGAIQAQQPLIAPCSGKPCVYYEIKVERMWEKTVNTENGVKTEKGTSTVSTNENGAVFQLNDGSGPVMIDAREKVDTDLTKAYEQAQNVSYGDLTFGQYHVHVPYSGGDEHTTGIRAIEKILPADGNLFAMGKLAGGTITKQDGMLGKILLSTKGRDKLIGSVKRNSIVGFVLGGLMLVPGGYFSIFGEPPVDTCANMADATKEACNARVSTNAGQTHEWKVTKEGTYEISVTATGTNAAMKLWPRLTVSKSGGEDVGEDGAGSNDSAKVTAKFEKGTYKLLVRDVDSNHIGKLKGGAGYTLVIKQIAGDDKETDKTSKNEKTDEVDPDKQAAADPPADEPKAEEPKPEPKKAAPKAAAPAPKAAAPAPKAKKK